MKQRLEPVMTSSWRYMGHASENPMGVDLFGMVFGLGFVLSFGYWCTNFLVVQRAMAAESMSGARRTPLIGAFPKMLLPLIVILPGVAAVALSRMGVGYDLPRKGDGFDYDQVLMTLMAQFYPSGLLGVGLTGLMASFMSGMAGNVTAFNTVWTYDIYQGYIRKNAPDAHYLWVGRVTTVVGVLLSIGAAYLATLYNNIMDLLQLVFGFVNAPLFATFLLGMFWKRATANGAFSGMLSGTAAAALTHGLTMAEGKVGWIAIFAFSVCFVVTMLVSAVTRPKPVEELRGLVWGATEMPKMGELPWHEKPWVLGVIVLAACLVLNIIFW